jgi:hypothetical protein
MRYRCKFQFDSQTFKVILELLRCEICPIICDDAVWYSKAKNYGLDEVDCGCRILGCYRGCLYLLGELVDYHQHINMPSWPRFVQFSYHVETLLRKGLG